MPAEATARDPVAARRSPPPARKSAPLARPAPPAEDDWAQAANDSDGGWGNSTVDNPIPHPRPAAPGSQNEEFEYLFHLEKTPNTATETATASSAAGWDEGLERLSIVTLCPTEESWERLRAWIATYSAQESRRPWLAAKDEPLGAPAERPLTSPAPSSPAPAPTAVGSKPFDLAAALTRGDFPPLAKAPEEPKKGDRGTVVCARLPSCMHALTRSVAACH